MEFVLLVRGLWAPSCGSLQISSCLPAPWCSLKPAGPHWAGTTDCPHTTSIATFHLSNLLLYVSSSIKTLNIINVRPLYTLQAHSSSNERVQLQHCPWPALLHSTQDQGSMESPLPALMAAEVLSPPGCPQGTTHLLSFKIQVSGSITEHNRPPSFLGCPQAEPCRDLIPPWPIPPLKSVL